MRTLMAELLLGGLPAIETADLRCPAAQKQVAPSLRHRFQAKNALQSRLAVDKPLYIHRMRCAEHRFLKTSLFFSNIGAGPIQSLSRAFREP